MLILGGCAATVGVKAAPGAADPACARVMALLAGQEQVAGMARNEVNSQSTAAWGGGAVTLTCGLPPLPPSTDECQTVAGVDWVLTQADGRTRFTSFGRSPAVQVSISGQPTLAPAVLEALGPAVASLPTTSRRCV